MTFQEVRARVLQLIQDLKWIFIRLTILFVLVILLAWRLGSDSFITWFLLLTILVTIGGVIVLKPWRWLFLSAGAVVIAICAIALNNIENKRAREANQKRLDELAEKKSNSTTLVVVPLPTPQPAPTWRPGWVAEQEYLQERARGEHIPSEIP